MQNKIRIFIYAGILLIVLGIGLMYVNVVKLGNTDALMISVLALPIVLGIAYLFIGLKKLKRNPTIDWSMYISLGIVFIGGTKWGQNVVFLAIPFVMLIVGLFLPAKNDADTLLA